MENATKALLIAAAILIAIVLVSIGVFVLRQGQSAVGSVNMSEAEILSFNSKFTTYDGTQRGSNVNALLDRIAISNREQLEAGGVSISITGDSDAELTTDQKQVKKKVATNGYFTITSKDTNNDGIIDTIDIDDTSK